MPGRVEALELGDYMNIITRKYRASDGSLRRYKYIGVKRKVDGKVLEMRFATADAAYQFFITLYNLLEELGIEARYRTKLIDDILLSMVKTLRARIDGRGITWCGGWDLNPRRPPPSGPQPHTLSRQVRPEGPQGSSLYHQAAFPDGDPGVKDFVQWCQSRGTSLETCSQYARYLHKPLNPGNKWSVLAYKAYYRFVGREDLWASVKTRQSRPDLRVPSEREVLEALEEACSVPGERGYRLCWVYKLLLYSAMRLDEITRVLEQGRRELWVEFKPGLYRYPLNWKRGSKDSFQLYTIEVPPRIRYEGRLGLAKWVSNYASKHGILPPKYIRKFAATKMYSIAIDMGLNDVESTIDFIQGRKPRKVLAVNYLRLTALADKLYPHYAEWLRQHLNL